MIPLATLKECAGACGVRRLGAPLPLSETADQPTFPDTNELVF
jgi:hypothetical protein